MTDHSLANDLAKRLSMIELLEKRRELGEDVIVTFWSLVEKPANRRSLIMKSDGSFEGTGQLLKYDDLKGLAYVTVYEPEVEDTQGDFAKAETIEGWAHEFLKSGRVAMVDHEHNYRPGYGHVVESFIKRGEDPLFPNIRTGAWCGVIQLTDYGREVAKDFKGISFAGSRLTKKSEAEEVLRCKVYRPEEGFEGQLAYHIIQ